MIINVELYSILPFLNTFKGKKLTLELLIRYQNDHLSHCSIIFKLSLYQFKKALVTED